MGHGEIKPEEQELGVGEGLFKTGRFYSADNGETWQVCEQG